MKKRELIYFFLFLVVVTSACSQEFTEKKEKNRECPSDTRLCADGKYVGRDQNNNCEFFSCASLKDADYELEIERYLAKKEECEKKGGIYFQEGILKGGCMQKLGDAGKPCQDSFECLGECIAKMDETGEITYKTPNNNKIIFKKYGECASANLSICSFGGFYMEKGRPIYQEICSSI